MTQDWPPSFIWGGWGDENGENGCEEKGNADHS